MTTLNEIQNFFAARKIAVAGASRNPKKFGGAVFRELKEKGFEVYPVNPVANDIEGEKCFHSVLDLPVDVKHLLIITPKKNTSEVAGEAIAKGMDMVWIQQKSETPEAVNALQEAGVPLIHNKCIMMFADPVKGPHKFHRFLVKFFGSYPKKVDVELV